MTTAMPEHIDELLPAYLNGTLAAAEAARVGQHLTGCAGCRQRLAGWQKIGSAAQLLASGAPSPSRGVLARVWARIDDGEQPVSERPRRGRANLWRGASGIRFRGLAGAFVTALAVLVLGVALALTPLGTYAQSVLHIFQPKQFVAAPVTMQDLSRLPDLDHYGSLRVSPGQAPRQVGSRAEAGAIAGMTVLAPASLPSGVPVTPTYGIIPEQRASFTFSADRLRAADPSAPPMPASIDGSTLVIQTGTAVLTFYGDSARVASLLESSAGGSSTATAALGQGRALLIVQAKAPTVSSTGASAEELKQYLLSQPGISPQLAEAVRAIGDPAATWPVPIPIGSAGAHSVTVRGAPGLAIADSTGLGGGLLWVEQGMVFAIGGTLTEKELLAVANALQP
jgi:hypothetical protein